MKTKEILIWLNVFIWSIAGLLAILTLQIIRGILCMILVTLILILFELETNKLKRSVK